MKINLSAGTAILTALLVILPACVNASGENTVKNDLNNRFKYATFAGGCFWCMEQPFELSEGVADVVAGYTGGDVENPGYEEVSQGNTGHYEAIQITYDPEKISYAELLEIFWRQIDPTDAGGQFVDRGPQYKTAIFYHDQEQKQSAEKSKSQLENSGKYGKPIATQILPYKTFYTAEDYHQDYYKKNQNRYEYYKQGSGRADYLKKSWQQKEVNYEDYRKPPDEDLRTVLNPLQYAVTQQDGTEPAFINEYWNNEEEGIYVDIVSGEPLFSSTSKYQSGTGWPSFTRPLEAASIVEIQGSGYTVQGIEVRSKYGDSHLGHVFGDGPPPTGRRYCINSAALRFIPKDKLAQEGYSKYEYLFDK